MSRLHHGHGHLLDLRLAVAPDDFQREAVLPDEIACRAVDRDEGGQLHDETPGVDVGSDDVLPSPLLDGLFASVADPVSGTTVIGYAQDTFALSSSVNYGTDGSGAPVQYGLALSADNVLSGLQTTDGHATRCLADRDTRSKMIYRQLNQQGKTRTSMVAAVENPFTHWG